MDLVVIGVALTGRVWRLTHNGRVLGDSRGYLTAEQAWAEAKKLVAADPEYRRLAS